MSALNLTFQVPEQSPVTVAGEVVQFSAFRCFPMTGDEEERIILQRLGLDLIMGSRSIAIYRSGPFCDFLLETMPAVLTKVGAIIDPAGGEDRGHIRVVRTAAELPQGIDTIFIAETRTEARLRIQRRLPRAYRIASPDDAKKHVQLVPARAWIPVAPSIYPIKTPEITIRPGVDFLLLDLPARAGEQIPVGLCYVHAALQRQKVDFQTIDANMIFYHRFHMHRLFDLGCEPRLRSGVTISTDAWGYNERTWVDPRQWPFLLDYFADVIDEIFDKIVAARPKVLGMSVHQRNEWITRALARRVKAALPETVILVGGHSCFSEPFGRGAFPEHDYMVIGEADMVVGPLAEKLIRGERPANLPGVISVHDDPSKPFLPGPMPHNLDMLGGIVTTFFDDWNTIYQTWDGFRSTAMPLTRGCVWSRCSFCAERFSFRTRTAANYVDEMEAVMRTGRPGIFSASDSDFGGRPETLYEICEEILKRGIKVHFGGQIRLNKKFNIDFFRTMKAAGVTGLNFGADAFTENTIRAQMKGYTLETLIQNHRDCAAAGIVPNINIVIGVPGETDQDLTDTIKILSENRDCFPMVNNINACMLVQNSVYWFNPEKFNIFFYGDKEEIYKRYYFGVPSRLWYSTEPFIDKYVRAERFNRLVNGLAAANIVIGGEVFGNLRDIMSGMGHMDYREMALEPVLAADVSRLQMPAQAELPPVPKRLHMRYEGNILAFSYDPALQDIMHKVGAEFWTTAEAA